MVVSILFLFFPLCNLNIWSIVFWDPFFFCCVGSRSSFFSVLIATLTNGLSSLSSMLKLLISQLSGIFWLFLRALLGDTCFVGESGAFNGYLFGDFKISLSVFGANSGFFFGESITFSFFGDVLCVGIDNPLDFLTYLTFGA